MYPEDIILMRALINIVMITMFLNTSTTFSQDDHTDLESLPKDSGGIHKANALGVTDAVYGHYIYTPSGYSKDSSKYPLLVFLHGSGERGNSKKSPDKLKKVIIHGPPKLIENKTWSPKYPMIVASPQLPSGNWKPEDIHDFITYLISNYHINTKRIYVTGLSLGGYGSFNYISKYSLSSYAAAIVPVAGGGDVNSGDKFTKVPVWAFHGDSDKVVPQKQSIDMITAINQANPNTKAKLTIYPDIGHDSWTKTYNAKGMGSESKSHDAFDMNIYDWMFMFKKQ